MVYPIGSIYTNASDSTNPATLLGFGTWEAFGAGRVMVGKASSGTFATAGATGGAETHTLTVAQMPSHSHSQTAHSHAMSGQGGFYGVGMHSASSGARLSTTGNSSIIGEYYGNTGGATANIGNTGSGSAHNNLQPYIVVYAWKRTA